MSVSFSNTGISNPKMLWPISILDLANNSIPSSMLEGEKE